jgi:type IV pilus assembly protein PilB
VEKHKVLPIRIEGNKLFVAMDDPLDYFAIDELRMVTGMRIEPVIALKDELQRAINRYYGMQENVEQVMQNIQLSEVGEAAPQEDENSPVVKTVNQIILQAVRSGASDIHIDPQEDSLRIRYRVDGVMRTEQSLPPSMQNVIVARIKVLANMNVAERRLPQDGRVEIDVDFRKVDLRISTLPTIHGEKVVMRILDMNNLLTEVERLGFSDHNLQLFHRGIGSPHGIVFITGPTGSGKTTTLYAALSRLNSDEVNIITIEDPVEYQMPGINQMQVNHQTGLTFARGLRSILRQDPNIVMVGEIRDAETAEIAVRAAMTGHLVLSTLHSNSAVNAITRLIDMGVEPFLVASSLRCVVAQRLVRKICPHCAAEYEPSPMERETFAARGIEVDKLRKGEGCGVCARTGYQGRLAIQEVLLCDDKLRSMILDRLSDSEYRNYAMQHGLVPMLKDGLSKAAQGLTTLNEVFRVTSGD